MKMRALLSGVLMCLLASCAAEGTEPGDESAGDVAPLDKEQVSLEDLGVSEQPLEWSFCSTQQQQHLAWVILGAYYASEDAVAVTESAVTTRNPSARWRKWFGAYERTRAEMVTIRIHRIRSLLLSGDYKVYCDNGSYNMCKLGAWAFNPYNTRTVGLCPKFFTLPGTGGNSQVGGFLHELAHVSGAGAIVDTTDGRDPQMSIANAVAEARDRPHQAIRNAYNYQYFYEGI